MGAKYEKPEGYMPRVADAQIERYLKAFGAVEIAGTKWCGKTWSALMQGASVSYVDENLDLARADPSMMLIGTCCRKPARQTRRSTARQC